MYDKSKIYHWYIYLITSPSGRYYVGRTSDLKRRWKEYKYYNGYKQKLLERSFNKYGVAAHKFEVLEEVDGTLSFIDDKEMFWIRSYMCNIHKYPEQRGLNSTDGGGGTIGAKHSEDAKIRNRERNKTNPSRGMLGKKASEETRMLQSLAKKGKQAHNKGKPMPPHQKEFLRKINTGRPSWNKGKDFSHLSEEERKSRFGSHNIGNTYNKGRIQKKEFIEARRLRQIGKPLTKKWKPVVKYTKDGDFVCEYPSVGICAKENNTHAGLISAVLVGKAKSSGGFVYKYKAL